jgi:hypothetical protein
MRINFLGGPCSGKSTTAAWLFSELKQRHLSIELVTEFVKSWACQKRKINSFDQIYLLGKQMQCEYIFLSNGIKNVITDSPVFLSSIYSEVYHKELNVHIPMREIINIYESEHPSINIFLNRNDKPYNSEGRYQTYEEAIEIDNIIKNYLNSEELKSWNVKYLDYNNKSGILDYVLNSIDK